MAEKATFLRFISYKKHPFGRHRALQCFLVEIPSQEKSDAFTSTISQGVRFKLEPTTHIQA
jgi:hypothetical protein